MTMTPTKTSIPFNMPWLPHLGIGEGVRSFFVQRLTHSLNNPTGNWRDYQEAVKRWEYLNKLSKSNDHIIRPGEVPPYPNVDDYPLID